MITCSYCGKQYKWDWEQDVVVDRPHIMFEVAADKIQGGKHDESKDDVLLEVYFCTCGGCLVVTTIEPDFGSSVLEYRPEGEEEDIDEN